MSSVFHKDAILTGYVDHYCLVCESHLKSEDDICSHIAKPIHTKNLNAASYVEKFINDCVRKVKKGYYCEFCNILLTTAAKVSLHVVEKTHHSNKGSTLLRRHGSSIVAFLDVLIGEKAWNGLIEETCATCNTDFDDEQIHKTETKHILSLVQCKVEFGAGKAVYRKIDDSSFQCLTCNRVLALSDLDTHFDLSEHKELIIPFVETKDSTKDSQPKETQAKDTQAKDNVKAKVEKPFELKFHFGDPPKKNDKEPNKAKTPKNDEKSKITETKKVEITETKKFEIIRRIKEDPKVDLDEELCKIIGAKDYIGSAEMGMKWCIICDWNMDGGSVTNHLQGKHHKEMLKMHKDRIAKKVKEGSIILEKPEKVPVKKPIVVESVAEVESKAKILDNLSKLTNNEININFESKTAVCKKCTKNIIFDHDAIENHIEEHKKEERESKKQKKDANDQGKNEKAKPRTNAKTTENTKTTNKNEKTNETESEKPSLVTSKEAEKYAKSNGLIHNRGEEKVYCKTCDKHLPFCLKNMKEHVRGLSHKKKAISAVVKIPFGEFMKSCTGVERGEIVQDVIINDKYCVNMFSFMMFIKIQSWLKCVACDVEFGYSELGKHEHLPPHMKAMCETRVIASMESEFLREVRPDILHCGFCNMVTDACDLNDHLASICHRESKAAGNWRLQQYTGDIALNPRGQEMESLRVMRLLVNNRCF